MIEITAETVASVENDITNLLARYPSLRMDRRAAVDNFRDGLATVIADDVIAGMAPDPATLARYAYLTELWKGTELAARS